MIDSKFAGWAKQIRFAASAAVVTSVLIAVSFIVLAIGLDQGGTSEMLAALGLAMLIFVACFVSVFAWLWISLASFTYRGAQLATEIQGKPLTGKTNKLAFWGWFIPLAGLITPYLYLKSITRIAGGSSQKKIEKLLLLFWLPWALTSMATNLVDALAKILENETFSYFAYAVIFAISAVGLSALLVLLRQLEAALFEKVQAARESIAETTGEAAQAGHVKVSKVSWPLINLVALLALSVTVGSLYSASISNTSTSGEYQLSEAEVAEGYMSLSGEPIAYRYLENPTCEQFAYCVQLDLIADGDCPNPTVVFDLLDASGAVLATETLSGPAMVAGQKQVLELGSDLEVTEISPSTFVCTANE